MSYSSTFDIFKSSGDEMPYSISVLPDADPTYIAKIVSASVFLFDSAGNDVTNVMSDPDLTLFQNRLINFAVRGGDPGQKYRCDIQIVLSDGFNFTITGYVHIEDK